MQKKVPGTHFTDLEMITKLLTPPGSWSVVGGPAIEELDSGFDTPVLEESECEAGKPTASKFDWRLPQSVPEEEDTDCADDLVLHKYGFGLQQHGVFRGLTEELKLVLDIKEVDSLTAEQVRKLRENMERQAFDEDHYL